MTDDEARGPGDAKVWVGSMLPDKIFSFCERLEKHPKEVDRLEIRLFISQTFVGQAESDAWGQWLTELKTRPHDDRVMRARDGKLHKYRWDVTFSNPAVRDRFFQTLFDELRKARLKMDQISSLAYAIGSWRSGGETEKQTLRPKGGGPSQL